jgi:hypothetical protein
MHESMFETFLKTAHQNDKKASDERALVEAMKQLPPDVLFKIANGETKLAYLDDCVKSVGGSTGGLGWVEQFKDTPLFEQALQLEQQSIQIEQMEQQYRAQRSAERDQEPKFWEMQDQIRLQKRLLGLQLASSQLQQAGAASSPMAAPGPAAPPPSTTEAAGGAAPSPSDGKVAFAITEKGHQFDTERAKLHKEQLLDQSRLHQRYNALGHRDPATGENPATMLNVLRFGPNEGHPTAEARHEAYVAAQHAQGQNAWNPFGGLLTPLPEEQGATPGFFGMLGKVGPKKKEAFDHASEMGRRMAQGDYERAITTNLAAEMGQDLAKVALNLGAVGGALRSAAAAAPKALGNAGMIGAGVGALGGAAAGLQKDQQGQRHIGRGIMGAVTGGALGAAAGRIGADTAALRSSGLGMGEALQTAGTAFKDKAVAGARNLASQVTSTPNPGAIGEARAALRGAPSAAPAAAAAPARVAPTQNMTVAPQRPPVAPTQNMTNAAPPAAPPAQAPAAAASGVRDARTSVGGRVVPNPPVAAP